MQSLTLRTVDPNSQRELDHLCVFAMMTLWESRPEMRVDPSLLADFGYDVHRRMFETGLQASDQRYLIALDMDANIVGHSIVVVRHEGDHRYGYFWSRYVLPAYRRSGLARQFLRDSLQWFAAQPGPLAWADVHVHVDNAPLRAMFESEGFRVVDKRIEKWTYHVLRRDL